MKIFWSWQSDNHQPSGRYFVRDVLRDLARELSGVDGTDEADRPGSNPGDDQVVQVDHDTFGVSGSPPIADTILRKIREAAVFVADVTPIERTIGGKRVANPNVMIELGYALATLGHERIVLVMNTAEGGKLDHLPFDLRHWRAPITYGLGKDADDDRRAAVASELKESLRGAIMPALLKAAAVMIESLRRTVRAPELALGYAEEQEQPGRFLWMVPAPDIPSLDEIRIETPLQPLPGSGDAAARSEKPGLALASLLQGYGHVPHVSQWGQKGVEGYNRRVEAYYIEYEKFAAAQAEFERLAHRSTEIRLLLSNSGTLPATGVTVRLDFPAGIVLYEEDSVPAAPKQPDPPDFRPGDADRVFALPSMLSIDTSMPWLEPAETMRVDPEKRRIEFSLKELIHHESEELDEFYISFASESEIRTFDIRYTVLCRELAEPASGQLTFHVTRG
ncbi:hypothetical protein [Neorhizobium tomejilense]|uniref:hypothetical protein n=1 Tax=Neorhizobium tomejilense TaxID=2093828 RepID=UPI000CF86DB1|nr:hypothetical protein [Neorhizobium tomejilense]